MMNISLLQIVIYLSIILACVKPLGWYMAQVYQDQPCGLQWLLKPVERGFYRVCGIRADEDMGWVQYLTAVLIFNFCGFLLLYAIQRLQFFLPLNPQAFTGVAPDQAFNTAISFITNTNWQSYAGETTMSYFTQMTGLTVQNFISAATGMALLAAFTRGIARHEGVGLGNFWVDMLRSILYILLPLSILFSLVLVSQGVIQSLKPNQTVQLLQPSFAPDASSTHLTTQILPMGPVASQVAIKQLGTNGGGYFNANAAHPFENPTPLTNFLEMLAILLIPAAFCYTFGAMVGDTRQGWAILIAMLIIFIPSAFTAMSAEQAGNSAFAPLSAAIAPTSELSQGGNLEGKEIRFGVQSSALWAAAATASASGSSNAIYDSFTPIGGMVLLWLMQLGEVIFGGVGSGLYGMMMLVMITVFVAGLMVGRTPEYLGKKIEPYEMKMAAFAILMMPFIVLVATAIASVTTLGTSSVGNPGAHGYSEMLYAFTSMGNNNGSAFGGLNANTLFYNILGGCLMLMNRYWIAIAVLAIAGSLVQKKPVPKSAGTLLTHTPLFVMMLVFIILIVGALSFVPTLALGPIVEQLMLWEHYGR